MAPPLRYLRPGEQESLNAWLVAKLQEERREVLLHLEAFHRNLLDQFSERASLGVVDRNLELGDLGSSGAQYTPSAALIAAPMSAQERQLAAKEDKLEKQIEALQGQINQEDVRVEQLEEGTPTPSKDATGPSRGSVQTMDSDFRDPGAAIGFEATPHGQAFEWFWAFMIFMNAIVMAAAQQYHGLQIGFDLGYATYVNPQKVAWPGGQFTFNFFEKFFAVMFTIELLCRIVIYKTTVLRDAWFYFDASIVVFAWIIFFNPNLLGFNPTFARLARLSKLLRLVRLLRSQEIFDSLKLLIASIKASVHTLIWSLVVLFLIICTSSLFMNQTLESFLTEIDGIDEKQLLVKRDVFRYWGTFWRSLLTMFEVTFANWVPSCRLLFEQVDEAYGAFYLIYRCVIGLAVIMVVQAVFIQQTTKTTQIDDDVLSHQKKRAKVKLLSRLEKAFKKLDKSGDGFLEWEEFQSALQGNEIGHVLELFELEVEDFDTLFKLLDDGDGQISIDEFIHGVEHMKGGARALDLMEVKAIIKKMDAMSKR